METNELQLIAAKPLRELLGNISDMTLHRWLCAGTFPKPIVSGNKRNRLWRLADVSAWQEANRQQSDEQSPEHA